MTVAYLLIAVGAFVTLSAFVIRQTGEYMLDTKVNQEMSLCLEYAVQAEGWQDQSELWRLAQRLGKLGTGRVLFVDEAGVVQSDSGGLLDGARLNRPEVALAMEGNAAHGWYSTVNSDLPFYWQMILSSGKMGLSILYAAPIKGGGVLAYISPADEVYTSLFWFQARAFLLAMAVSIGVCILSVYLMRHFTRPVDQLSEGIARITRGDMESRVEVRGNHEFAQLARAFNMMCDQLETLNKTRNQFVSDASHELKTPLSTIKILIETLIYQDPLDPDLAHEFLGDVNKEIDRLSVIIGDLLTLVHMDSGDTPVTMAETPLSGVVSDTVSRLLPLSREKGIEMNCLIRDQITIQGNAMKLSQVFYNLIDNALKYTPRGGLVRMELYRSGKQAIFRVSDNGVGIPKEDLPRIFERFYRVDKTRSRETGGTGLGLSIVKQIVQLHGGEISVTSEEGKGTTFEVEFPCA